MTKFQEAKIIFSKQWVGEKYEKFLKMLLNDAS